MGLFYGNRVSCLGASLAASIVVGIVTAVLRFTAVITVTPAFLWVTFGVALLFLAVELAISPLTPNATTGCFVTTRRVFLAGVLGTVLLSLVLLAIPFAATSVLGAIVTGVLLFFFTLLLTGTACLIKRGFRCNS